MESWLAEIYDRLIDVPGNARRWFASPRKRPGGRSVVAVRHPRRCVSILVLKHQCEAHLSRLTITLSEARYKALKEAINN